MFTVFLNMTLFSCTPQGISDSSPAAIEPEQEQNCCGEDGDLPPPPPNGGN